MRMLAFIYIDKSSVCYSLTKLLFIIWTWIITFRKDRKDDKGNFQTSADDYKTWKAYCFIKQEKLINCLLISAHWWSPKLKLTAKFIRCYSAIYRRFQRSLSFFSRTRERVTEATKAIKLGATPYRANAGWRPFFSF